jgi:hypothetical protein
MTYARTAPAAFAAGRRRVWGWFFVLTSAAMLAIVLAGFARTFFLREYFGTALLPPGLRTLPGYLYLHGILLTCWFCLFLVQTTLIASARTDLHRRVGVGGAVLAVAMVLVSLIVTIRSVSRSPSNGTPLAEQPVVFGTSIGFLVAFSLLVAGGIYFRQRPEAHKRLMFLASFSILGPAVGRIPGLAAIPLVLLLLQLSPLIALVLYDVASRRRLHGATIWGGFLSIFVQVLGGVWAASDPGRAFIRTLR